MVIVLFSTSPLATLVYPESPARKPLRLKELADRRRTPDGVPSSPPLWNIEPVKRALTICLCGVLLAGVPQPSNALYGDDNPFVEAMLRMMEIFGLINRGSLPLGVPYLPSYGQSMMPGLGGMSGLGGMPGVSPLYGMGGMPGMWQVPGGGWPTNALPGQFPGMISGRYGQTVNAAVSGYLDGIWDLTNGGIVIIKRQAARLYVARDRYQDFTIGYDRQYFWWTPRGGNTTTHYRYQMRDGRMVLRDNDGQVLLMRRRS